MATKRSVHKQSTTQATKKMPVLTLKIGGPNIRKGRICVPDLIKICTDAQNAVRRQAEALAGRKTLHPGPTTKLIRHECTLELIAIRRGSTVLDFALSRPQLPLAFNEITIFGAEVVEELAEAIKSLGNGNRKKDIDPGVLQSIYALSSIIDSGRVSSLNWIAPKSARKKIDAPVTKKVQERAAAQLSRPRFRIIQAPNDLWIAASAVRHSIPLVSNNKKHFEPIPGLVVISEYQAMKEMQSQISLER